MDVAPGDAELDARAQELSAIEDFIAKNGVSVPTAEDFKPKKQSWRGKKSKKTDGQVAKERRGRPRTKYTKTMTFVIHDQVSPTWEGALWKRCWSWSC